MADVSEMLYLEYNLQSVTQILATHNKQFLLGFEHLELTGILGPWKHKTLRT